MKTSKELGVVLQEARKKQGLDVSGLAKRTGLPEKYLVALEAGQPELLPGEAYARIYYLNFARALKLDGDALLDEWPGSEPLRVVEAPEPKKKSPWLWRIVGLVVIVAALLFMFIRWSQNSTSTASPEKASRDVESLTDFSPLVTPPVESTLAAASPADSDSVRVAPVESTTTPPAPRFAQDAPREHELAIVTSAESWVQVLVDGDTVRRHLMPAATADTIVAHGDFLITVGRPESVTVTLDGKTVTLPATRGQPVRGFRIKPPPKESTP
jgi:cytoskeletal protein RodZ